ncbi:helix-turn-helix domain-containing protein [Neobacillus sp. SuZ13]|uniref:GH39 family glycosyl hydrolase n=1 Tax=Neobacillus sp. SuZ13 TaxID=3047875 RepID=UPI0024C0A132|nr:helix-turn-helix domain-containing protein [Neobacillus sp. SuZ13]WHY69038.1 helix-turn-helix domain-containing protein [Neobacillus sp. SuZ13]
MSGTHIFQTSIDSKLITVSVMSNKSNLEHAHREIELIYVIKGQLQVKIKGNTYHLDKADFILVNSNDFHSFQSEKDNLFIVFHFNYLELSSLLAQKNLLFTCNSVEQGESPNQELRIIVEELLSVYMQQRHDSEVESLEKTFKLISFLKLHYLKSTNQFEIQSYSTSKGQNDRLLEIIEYMQSNYREPLTLEEVAGLHYISVPYLSKFFKKQTGKTFSQYVNEIRLAHAVNELVNSNKPITRIALDNGFPNLAAFNRVFNENYQLKPVEYRKKMSETVEKETKSTNDISNLETNEALTELRQYLKNTEDKSVQALPQSRSTADNEIIKVGKTDSFVKYWNRLLNIGYAKDLLNSDMQEQINFLQSEIGFTYARFWGLFGDDMLLEDRSGGTIAYNFSNANKLLDFLIKNKLKPFIEMGPKPKIIQKAIGETLVIQTVSSERTLEEWHNLVTAFLLQCIERYGIEEVETWYFELWRPMEELNSNAEEEKDFLAKMKNNQDPRFDRYFKIFSEFKRTAQELVPGAKVGGCGLSMDLEGDKLDLLLEQWKQEEIQPDFLSIYLYPIEIDRDKYRVPIKNLHSTNPHYVLNKLNDVRKSLKKAGFENLELNVTEWNISISNRNYLNDSSFKASYMVKNIVENLNQNHLKMMGYWLSSDIFSDFRDSKNILHGGAGLVTKNGIKKPSFHAFVLLKQLGEILVAKGDNYIVTKKSGDRYQILCFNYKHFNYSYYLHPEGSTGIHEQYDIFENNEPLNLSLEIQGIANGKYRVKELKLNRNHGSVLDEWLKFGAVNDIKSDEVDYFKQICVPYMKVEHSLVENHTIVLRGELQPHEVRLFELNLLFGER